MWLSLLGLIAIPPATAQVTINLHALDAVPQATRAERHRAERPRRRAATPEHPPQVAAATKPPARETAAARPQQATPAKPQQATPAKPQPPPQTQVATQAPTMPAAPPAPPVATLGPPPAPAGMPAAPPAPAAAPAAAPAPSPTEERTLDVRFDAGVTALTPQQTASVAALVKSVHPSSETSFEVAAHAPAVAGDASSARRLSLDRAMAVRAALIAGGAQAAAVYMRALGAPPPAEAAQANTASITVMGETAGAAALSANPPKAKSP